VPELPAHSCWSPESGELVIPELLSPGLEVLDAGCGSGGSPIRLDTEVQLTGIDTSPEALALNSRLDRKLVGDVQIYAFSETYDAVLCWDTLEHLQEPLAAVRNLSQAVRHDGFLVLGFPNLLSAKGLLTKFTPHRFHQFYYRSVLKYPNVGEPGHPPFPTHLRWEMRPEGLVRYAGGLGLSLVSLELVDTPSWNKVARAGRKASGAIFRALTLSRMPDLPDCIVIFRRSES